MGVRRASPQEARQALYREEGEGSKATGSQTPSTRDSLRLGQVTNSPVWLGTSGASPHVSLGVLHVPGHHALAQQGGHTHGLQNEQPRPELHGQYTERGTVA